MTGSTSGDRPFPELVRALAPSLGDDQLQQLCRFRDALLERAATTNLTAVRDRAGIERRLIVESLRLLEPLREIAPPGGRAGLLDLGTGAGFPGLVLAIARPDLAVTLVDATGKKIAFLDDVVSDLGLHHVATRHTRAEDLAHEPDFRASFDIVTARAVTSLPALVELGLPFLKTGGHLLLPKGLDIDEELVAGRRACAIVGGLLTRASILPDGGSSIGTMLVTIQKISPTSGEFPRRSGIPSRTPLGMPPESRRTGTASSNTRRHE